ncbi:GS3-like protein [Panicum miliaceum]|uniref:GS3-like protein n=1 Tax=Panicum miliaceum TaxID=4540 RepID=A0A3L6SBV9_PANMI|nr:GS3-like protein [Panicum miliaceum]
MAAAAAPRPKSPPASPDPCGRHRLQLAVDALHREIGFLEGEISSIEGVHAASRCCKEVDEFVGRNPDPFITMCEFVGVAAACRASARESPPPPGSLGSGGPARLIE